jgi:hypothetical protein
LRAHAIHHLGDGMSDVVIPRAAEVGKAASDGEAARIVERDPHLVARNLHG